MLEGDMDGTKANLLAQARCALEVVAGRTADLLRSLPDLDAAIPGSRWTVWEAGAHLLTGTALLADIATGMPSPVPTLARETLAVENAQRIADIPESDRETLARLLHDAVKRLLEVTVGRKGDEDVLWHGGLRIDLAHLVCLSLGELLLHGYDMATASGLPWTIEPDHAELVIIGYAAIHEGEFRLDARDVGPAGGRSPADPVAFLLIGSGRGSVDRQHTERRETAPPGAAPTAPSA